MDVAEVEGDTENSYFEEAPEVLQLVQRVATAEQGLEVAVEAANVLSRLKSILIKYQEQPQLLDTHLEEIVIPLAQKLRACALLITAQAVCQPDPQRISVEDPPVFSSGTDSDTKTNLLTDYESNLKSVILVSRLLVVIVSVRGYKTVANFLPHEAKDLERVVGLIQAVKGAAAAPGPLCASAPLKPPPLGFKSVSGTGSSGGPDVELSMLAETQALLMLWLSVLVLLPFHLSTLDSSTGMTEAGGGAGSSSGFPPLVRTVLLLSLEALHQPGAVREMAALVLGRLLTRPDMEPALWRFVTGRAPDAGAPAADPDSEAISVMGALASIDDLRAPFLYPGLLQSLANVFKSGARARLLPLAHPVWVLFTEDIEPSRHVSESTLARRLAVKLAVRVAMTFLPAAVSPAATDGRKTGDSKGSHELDTRTSGIKNLEKNLERIALIAGKAAMSASPSGVPGVNSLGSGEADGKQIKAPATEESVKFPVEEVVHAGEDETLDKSDAGEGGEDAGSGSFALVEEVEEVIGRLLEMLRDKDTVVRWTAAKGIARVVQRLPTALGYEVIDAVCEFFAETETDAAWHGACLALAQLASRRLLPLAKTWHLDALKFGGATDRSDVIKADESKIVAEDGDNSQDEDGKALDVAFASRPTFASCVLEPVLTHALAYDVRRGANSVGAHVRDAAAYVLWALVHVYSPLRPLSYVSSSSWRASTNNSTVDDRHEDDDDGRYGITTARATEFLLRRLAVPLVVAACYDREVSCRRAAAAAFQEAVGRLPAGTIPHGLELLGLADYFSIGGLQQAYLGVGPMAAQHRRYRNALSRHLVTTKSRHWEKSLRELAARAAAALVLHGGAKWFAGAPLDLLLRNCLHPQLEVRHGAILMVAELLPALAATAGSGSSDLAATLLTRQQSAQVSDLVPAIGKARLYRGRGGELMREAVGRLIECMAAAGLKLTRTQHLKVLETLDENLRHPLTSVQRRAARALRAYGRAYFDTTPAAAAAFLPEVRRRYLSSLHNPNVAVRRGSAAALGALSRGILVLSADDGGEAGASETVDEREGAKNVVQQPKDEAEPVAGVEGGRDKKDEVTQRQNPKLLYEEVVTALLDGSALEEDPADRDPESRAACVAAMAAVASTLFGGLRDPAAGARVLCQQILPHLINNSMNDYATDSRGDVGSWVREEAMEALAGLRLRKTAAAAESDAAAANQRDAAKNKSDTHTTHPQALAVAGGGGPIGCLSLALDCCRENGGSGGDNENLAAVQALLTAAIGQLLKQAVERISRIREAAAGHVLNLLNLTANDGTKGEFHPSAVGTWISIPDADRIQDAIRRSQRSRFIAGAAAASTSSAVAGQPSTTGDDVSEGKGSEEERGAGRDENSGSCEGKRSDGEGDLVIDPARLLDSLADLLDSDVYRDPLLEGLIASIGCVDFSLASLATSALQRVLNASSASPSSPSASAFSSSEQEKTPAGKPLAPPTSAGEEEGVKPPLIDLVTQSFLRLWDRHTRSPRMATPMIRTALLLLTKTNAVRRDTEATEVLPQTSTFAAKVLEATKREVKGCNDVQRLTHAVSLLCELILAEDAAAAAVAATNSNGPSAGDRSLPQEAASFGDDTLNESVHVLPYLRSESGVAALKSSLVQLGSRFSKVRRHAAEQLYVQFISLEDIVSEATGNFPSRQVVFPTRRDADAAQVVEEVSDILLASPWDTDAEGSKESRDKIAAALGVTLSLTKVGSRAGGRAAAAGRDENASYQALLDDFARGY